jgi:glycosyltransferase involved in cell wall biosynthesis
MPARKPLSILHVCPRPSFSGLEAYAYDIGFAQRELGHSVTYVVLAGSPLARKCSEAGFATIEMQDSLVGRLMFIAKISARLRGGSRADSHALGGTDSNARPDIIHLHSTQDLDLMLVPLTASRAKTEGARPKVILQTHIWISHTKRDPLHAISYALIDEVWCSSPQARATLIEFLPIAARKIRVVHYGRKIEQMEKGFLCRADARLALKISQEALVIGNVGRIDKGKGTRELLDAALKVMSRNPKLELVLIGSATADDPKAVLFGEQILADISELPADPKVRMHALGNVPDSYKYLKAFDLFVLPTYQECFSLSLLEAMLAGLPCLATHSGGSPEIVRENETGWLFAPRSAESLEQSLEEALGQRESWSKMGSLGRDRVRKYYDFSKTLPELIDGYYEVLGSK